MCDRYTALSALYRRAVYLCKSSKSVEELIHSKNIFTIEIFARKEKRIEFRNEINFGAVCTCRVFGYAS